MGVNVVAKDATYHLFHDARRRFTAYDRDRRRDPTRGFDGYRGVRREQAGIPTARLGRDHRRKNDQVTDGHWSVKWVDKLEISPWWLIGT
jgi:hypothetical protein